MRRLLIVLTAMAGMLFGSPAVFAEEAVSPDILDRLGGTWVSAGDAFGAPAMTTMIWTPTLAARFYRLDYKIEMRPAPEKQTVFEGAAYYRPDTNGGFEGFWADNAGALHPIAATVEDNTLVANWGVEGGKQGRTHYAFIDADTIEVTDWVRVGDDWRQFNQNRFHRKTTGDH